MSNAKILIVEDESIVAKDIQNRLKRLGYNVPNFVSSGEEAVNKAAETCPDIVLMDINLKGKIDGVEAAKKIHSHFNIPVIYLTAFADNATLERAKETEPSGYLIKPFRERELYTTIEITLSNRRAERARQKQTEQEFLIAQLEKLNQLKDDFLSTVSHELRTPMSNIKMAIQMLKMAPTAERRQRYLDILQTECTREIELINDLLQLQRLAAASYPVFLAEAMLLQDWLPSIVEPLRARTQEYQQILQVNLPSNLPPLVSDRASLERILIELLDNACKYTPANGEIILNVCNSSSKAACLPDSAATIFTISNQAEIPAADLQHVFSKFYRVPNADPWKQGGTGLGLALVQKLVEQLHGNIQVESSKGWTTFTIQLTNLVVIN